MSESVQPTNVTNQVTAQESAPTQSDSSRSQVLSPLPLLVKGSQGAFVKLLQRLLVSYGYFKAQIQQGLEPVDGNFGDQTTAEVIKFQGEHFLNKDGRVGGLTWCAIAFPKDNPNDQGALSPIGDSSTALSLLQSGDRGAAVFVLQRLLLRYTPEYIPGNPMKESGVDGVFGANTKAAVTIFQKSYKHAQLTPDGQVGTYTWGALFYPSGQRSETK
jgi:peptidoglycan hydrolase-like protein with peptidoglycan-binding domain